MKVLTLFILVTFTATARSIPPAFGEGTALLCAGNPIDVGTYSDPLVVDWNEDSLKDLIVGQFSEGAPDEGKIRIYLNEGTNPAPVFTAWTYMQADGSDIVCPSG